MTPPGEDGARPARSTAEWLTFAVSLALVAAVFGVILASWATGPSGPPVLRAERSGPVEYDGRAYRVPFAVRNEGGGAATDVQVTAELTIDGTLEGEGEQTFMFLSGGERASGEFLFTADPARGTVTIEVASYSHP